MRVGILTANLGDFDEDIDSVNQRLPKNVEEIIFHRWTDKNFPPITVAMSPRFQYRIPKLFGWQMLEKMRFDYIIWLDGSCSFQHLNCTEWFLDQIGNNDVAFFKHPWRDTIKEEAFHIDEKLKQGGKYITVRYKNGLHRECYDEIRSLAFYGEFVDDKLFASTSFIYKNTQEVQNMMKDWWYWQSRYFSCDQLPLPYVLWKNKLKVKVIEENPFKTKYLSFNKH